MCRLVKITTNMTGFIKGLGLDLYDFNSKFLSVAEGHLADASFCVSGFMWQAFNKPGRGVCLIAVQHSLRHYYHVGMRLGYNLSSAYGKKFLAIDSIDIREANFNNEGKHKELNQKVVLELIRHKVSLLKQYCNEVFIVVDDLSNFMNLGVSPKDVFTFVQYIRVCFQQDSTIIICSHCNEDDVEQVNVKNTLLHFADLRLDVKCLETGFSKEVTGSIEITRRDENSLKGWSQPVLYHYKAKERSIDLFLPGNITFSY